ncbi:proteasome-type protease [Marinobacter caseinilyticus]|uniref:proteasome-type protease n=1 Tax=Marinobacter caseinilyticus TaxID=2692195 RepID=UPI001409FCFA|nr:proteasome-type protease [Marinobacter caseinilyticus]
MTYCVAMRLADGLVFASDTRTNAGFDQISTFRKMHTFKQPGERLLTIMTAGNLATSQSVISMLEKRLGSDTPNLLNVTSLFEAAELLGETLREVVRRDHTTAGEASQVDFTCSMILGGQIRGEAPKLFHIYQEGNFIEATPETPYFQIGEAKYGKPVLDRALGFTTPLDRAYQCALISFDSTMKSNLSVGMPIDVMIYRKDDLEPLFSARIEQDDRYFWELRQQWNQGIRDLIDRLPVPDINLR